VLACVEGRGRVSSARGSVCLLFRAWFFRAGLVLSMNQFPYLCFLCPAFSRPHPSLPIQPKQTGRGSSNNIFLKDLESNNRDEREEEEHAPPSTAAAAAAAAAEEEEVVVPAPSTTTPLTHEGKAGGEEEEKEEAAPAAMAPLPAEEEGGREEEEEESLPLLSNLATPPQNHQDTRIFTK
jgi:hypothetical protein